MAQADCSETSPQTGKNNTSAQRVILLLDRLARLTRELQFVEGLNPAQWETLRFLAQSNRYSRTPSALADYLGATKGTVSQTLIALENKGLVERKQKTCDRRQVAIALTEAGTEILKRDPMRVLEDSICHLTQDCGQTLVDGLGRLLNELQAHREAHQFGFCQECSMFCKRSGEPLDPAILSGKHCGKTGESLHDHEARQLCVNYTAAT